MYKFACANINRHRMGIEICVYNFSAYHKSSFQPKDNQSLLIRKSKNQTICEGNRSTQYSAQLKTNYLKYRFETDQKFMYHTKPRFLIHKITLFVKYIPWFLAPGATSSNTLLTKCMTIWYRCKRISVRNCFFKHDVCDLINLLPYCPMLTSFRVPTSPFVLHLYIQKIIYVEVEGQ